MTKSLHSSRRGVTNSHETPVVDGPLFLCSLRVTGARNPRCHSTHSHRDPRSDGLTILCGRWRAIKSGQPGSGHSAWGFPEQCPGKPRYRHDGSSDGSPRKRTKSSIEPPRRSAKEPWLFSLPCGDHGRPCTASLTWIHSIHWIVTGAVEISSEKPVGPVLRAPRAVRGIPKGVTRERRISCVRNTTLPSSHQESGQTSVR